MGLLAPALAPSLAHAQDVLVPVRLQVELLAKLLPYDRNFVDRVQGRVRVLVLTQEASAESQRIAEHVSASLVDAPRLGGFPHEHVMLPFEDSRTLRSECRARSIAIVYLTSDLDRYLGAIVSALTGLDLLSVAAVPHYVRSRAVLGFDLVSSKPKMLIHLAQARAQNVDFRSEILKLARVLP